MYLIFSKIDMKIFNCDNSSKIWYNTADHRKKLVQFRKYSVRDGNEY